MNQVLFQYLAIAEESQVVKAVQEYQDRLVKEGVIDAAKREEIYNQIVKPAMAAHEEEQNQKAKSGDKNSNSSTSESGTGANAGAPAPEKKEEAAPPPSEVKPLEFGTAPSSKPTSSKFEIDLTDAPKSPSEAEIVFEAPEPKSPKPKSMPSPSPSPKPSVKK